MCLKSKGKERLKWGSDSIETMVLIPHCLEFEWDPKFEFLLEHPLPYSLTCLSPFFNSFPSFLAFSENEYLREHEDKLL